MARSVSIKIAEIRSGEKKFVAVVDAIKAVVKYAVIAFLGWKGFELIIAGFRSSPESISALADFCDHFSIGDIMLLLVSALGLGWGAVERHRNRRLVKENGDMRRRLESHDEYQSRSGLDAYGSAKGD